MVFPAPFGVFDREATLAAVAGASPWIDIRLDDVHVVRAGETVIVAYRADARKESGEFYSTYAGSVYIHEGGAWRLAFHQQTPIGT